MKAQQNFSAYVPQLPREQPRTRYRRLAPPNMPEPKTRYSAFSGSTPAFSSRRVMRPSKARSTSCMASC